MHVHKPKTVHSLREFLSEIAIIVVGIVIALSGEQALEALHWRHEVEVEREALLSDIREQLRMVAMRRAQQVCVDRRLDDLAAIFGRHARGESLGLLGPVGRPQNASVENAIWDIAVSSQAASHMAFDERSKFSGAFANFENLRRLEAEADRAWVDLSVLDHPEQLSEGDWVELRRAFAEARETEGRIRFILPYVLRSWNLGQPVARVTARATLVQDYSRAFCRPLTRR
ncbi:MAG TPA: hypothetical protein VMF67_12870 [Rhizomicrobium sp.]|nr:hypothetical protein [Rhizomicrobium sp.]